MCCINKHCSGCPVSSTFCVFVYCSKTDAEIHIYFFMFLTFHIVSHLLKFLALVRYFLPFSVNIVQSFADRALAKPFLRRFRFLLHSIVWFKRAVVTINNLIANFLRFYHSEVESWIVLSEFFKFVSKCLAGELYWQFFPREYHLLKPIISVSRLLWTCIES